VHLYSIISFQKLVAENFFRKTVVQPPKRLNPEKSTHVFQIESELTY